MEKFDENVSQDITPVFKTPGSLKIRALQGALISMKRSRKAGKNGFHRSGESINRKTVALYLDAGRGRSTQVLFQQL